jgi:hypothetical protein
MWKWLSRPKNELKKAITQHMGGDCADAQSITHSIKPIERVNLQVALDRWFANNERPARLIGYSPGSTYRNTDIAQLLQGEATPAPVQRQQFPLAPENELDCVVRGIYLLHFQKEPVVVLLSTSDSTFEQPSLELLAGERPIAQSALKELLAEVNRHAAYKGKTIYLQSEGYPSEIFIRFRELPPAPRDAIILPTGVMDVVERNVLGMIKHGDVLRRSGRATRHGVLLHGPPGTGKTLALRYLAQACNDHTIVLLAGRDMGLLRESCQMARLLAPSLIILEDVDLVAEERTGNRCPTILHDLMDEMDGLGPKADCIFLLTTNRPEAIEPALSARPGRIDQAIEFPLPDEEARRRLFLLYGRGLDLSRLDLDRWIAKTSGTSPAFIEELLRKATLMAAERGEVSDPLALADADVEAALNELVYFGGELTQKLLGFTTLGFRAPSART